MGIPAKDMQSAFNALVQMYRPRCLWFLRPDYFASTIEEKRRVLDSIERHGDLEAFRQVAVLRTWLSQSTNEASAQ